MKRATKKPAPNVTIAREFEQPRHPLSRDLEQALGEVARIIVDDVLAEMRQEVGRLRRRLDERREDDVHRHFVTPR